MKTSRFLALLLGAAFATATLSAKEPALPKDYPLKKCPISDESLGGHGKPVKVTGPDGTAVYLCCDSCKEDFDKDPAKYTKMVQDAKKK